MKQSLMTEEELAAATYDAKQLYMQQQAQQFGQQPYFPAPEYGLQQHFPSEPPAYHDGAATHTVEEFDAVEPTDEGNPNGR